MKIVVIVADSVRHDAFGCFGGAAQTPTVDTLATEGVSFSHAFSAAPWTVPSLASMLTGVYSHRLGLAKWEQPLPSQYPSVFDAAHGQGIKVASFVFDRTHLFRNTPAAGVAGTSQDTQGLIDWIRRHKNESYLLFVHYWWTHVPYVAKPMSIAGWRKATDQVLHVLRMGQKGREAVRLLYRRGVEHFSEDWLPQVLGELEQGDPWVFLTSDHGESWGERPETAALRDVFDLHGNTLYNDVIRVPLIVRVPREKSASLRRPVDGLVRTVDLAPTIGDLMKSDLFVSRSDLDGISLLPVIQNEIPCPKLDAISVMNRDFVDSPNLPERPNDLWSGISIASTKNKLIWRPREGIFSSYDLETDPLEQTALDAIDSAKQRILESELKRAIVGNPSNEDQIAISERLRALGYAE